MDPSQIDQTMVVIRNALEAGRIRDAIAELLRLHPADRAEAFSDLNQEDQSLLLNRLEIPVTADLLEELEDQEAASVAETMSADLLADVLDEMKPDEAADILGDLPENLAAEALAEMTNVGEVLPLLSHADETAGGRMTTSYISLRRGTSAAEAIDYLRAAGPDAETSYYLYVVDMENHLVGIVSLRDLVVAPPDMPVENFMAPEVYHAHTLDDQEDVARMMVRYDLAAIPVVDDNEVVQGVITYDDLFDVIEEEATEDIYRLANVSDPGLGFDSPVSLSIRRRLPWLYVNTFTALFAAWVISNFESVIAQVALLAAFQSMVAGLGGNTATQSLAIMVRAIALGEVETRQAGWAAMKEGLTGLLQGLFIGVTVGVAVAIWKGNPMMGLVLGLAMVGNMLMAGVAGAVIPLALKALRLDPALASSVLVTAITDSFGFALFLGLATLFLPYLR